MVQIWSAPGSNSYHVFFSVMEDKLGTEENEHICNDAELVYYDEDEEYEALLVSDHEEEEY